jgi:chromate transporter
MSGSEAASAPAAAPGSGAVAGAELVQCTFAAFLLYFLRLGALGFGGPIALAGYMQRDLVEKRRWISKQDYVEGLALAQLAPGPLAAQLAMYLGWVRAGVLGATLVGVAFILPSFLMVLGLAALYVQFGELAWMRHAFYGVGAAVIAIIARSAYKLVRLTVGRDWLLWVLFAVNAAVTAWTESEIVWVFLLSGVVALLVRAPPGFAPKTAVLSLLAWPGVLTTGLQGPADGDRLAKLTWFFTKAGAFVFGSGLAIVPFLRGGVVQEYEWLNDAQFLDAVAVAMITPGPVVITAGFIGYLVAGPVGAALAAAAVFVPCYLMVLILAPYYRHVVKNRQIKAFVSGVTAAATGAIAGAVFVLGRRAIIDPATVLIAAVTLGVILYTKKVPEPLVILAAGVVGVLLRTAGLG